MILYGASGHGKVVYAICKDEVSSFIDDDISLSEFEGLPVYRYEDMKLHSEKLVITIGDNRLRRNVSKKINHSFSNVISKSSNILNGVSLGLGNQIIQSALIQVGVNIGSHCIINSMCSIDHDCLIGDFVHIAPGSTLCGNVAVGEGTMIGAGSTIVPGIEIGKWSVIGAGSVVVNNIPDKVLAFGNPAKIIKKID